jgi:hypothetical protein
LTIALTALSVGLQQNREIGGVSREKCRGGAGLHHWNAAIDRCYAKYTIQIMASTMMPAVTLNPSTSRTLCPVTPCRACRAGIIGRRSGRSEELMAFSCFSPLKTLSASGANDHRFRAWLEHG